MTLKFYYDEALTKPSEAVKVEGIETALIYKEDVELLPGEKTQQEIWVAFQPSKPFHMFDPTKISVSGDAEYVSGLPTSRLKSGDKFKLTIEYLHKEGKFKTVDDLDRLSAGIVINGKLLALARRE